MKKTVKQAERKIFNKPWKHLLVAAAGLALSYAFASWAIDSGRLTAYFLAIVLAVVAVYHTTKAVRGYAGQS
jgi:hypothetical protein